VPTLCPRALSHAHGTRLPCAIRVRGSELLDLCMTCWRQAQLLRRFSVAKLPRSSFRGQPTSCCDFLETRAQKISLQIEYRINCTVLPQNSASIAQVGKRSLFVQPILPTGAVRVAGCPCHDPDHPVTRGDQRWLCMLGVSFCENALRKISRNSWRRCEISDLKTMRRPRHFGKPRSELAKSADGSSGDARMNSRVSEVGTSRAPVRRP
jgi:hypothetical protein